MKNLNADLAELSKRSQTFVAIFNRNDAASLAALYTADAELLVPGLPRLTGLAAVESFWKTAFSRGKRTFDKVEPVTTVVDGDLAVEYANWHLSVDDRQGNISRETGKNVLVWKRVNAEWLISLDIWNSP